MLVLIRERTHFPKQLLEKLPRLKLISQTGRVGSHIDVETCTRMGIAVAEGVGSPVAPAELTWALIMAAMRRLPQYIGNLKHGAWQQSGLKAASMPANFGLGMVLKGKTLGIWGYGKIGQLVAGYGRAFGMSVMVWGSESARARAVGDGYLAAPGCAEFFAASDVLSVHLRLTDATRGIVKHDALAQMAVIGSLELVLDDHRPALAVLGEDVEPEVSDRHLRCGDCERHAELFGQHIDVLRQPWSEVP